MTVLNFVTLVSEMVKGFNFTYIMFHVIFISQVAVYLYVHSAHPSCVKMTNLNIKPNVRC